MFTATHENIETILGKISSLQAGGGTNFRSGFAKAFDVFEATLDDEYHVPCNSAVLFLVRYSNVVVEVLNCAKSQSAFISPIFSECVDGRHYESGSVH